MTRILEDDSKKLLQNHGVPIPRGRTARTAEEAARVAEELACPVVIKALLPIGGRKKAGGVSRAQTAEQAGRVATGMLGSKLLGFPVEKLLVEEEVEVCQELFLSILNDGRSRKRIILLSSRGGVDVEEILEISPDVMASFTVDPLLGFELYQAKELWLKLGQRGPHIIELSKIVHIAYGLFDQLDATLMEINPLAITKVGQVVALSSVLVIDDDARFRQPTLQFEGMQGMDRIWRPLTARERDVVEADSAEPYRGTVRYTELEGGNIALVCGGGGGSLVTLDAINNYGGKPANYSEWGGNPTQKKVETLVRSALAKPGVAGLLVCLNISNNTRIDVAAAGIVDALKQARTDPEKFPVVIRLAGINDTAARKTIEDAGLLYHGEDITMEEAASLIVKLVEKS